jgi:hypothetical protein
VVDTAMMATAAIAIGKNQVGSLLKLLQSQGLQRRSL